MNRKLLLIPFLSVIAACNAPTPAVVSAQPDVTATASTPAATQTAADTVVAPGAMGNALPEDVIISAPYQLRADHVVTNKDGKVRRQITYDYPDAESSSAATTVEAAFTSAGFKLRPQKAGTNGDTVLVFDKSQFGTAYAILKHPSGDASLPRTLLVDFPASK